MINVQYMFSNSVKLVRIILSQTNFERTVMACCLNRQAPIHFRFFQVSDVTQWYGPFVAISSEECPMLVWPSEGYARGTFSAENRKLAISRKEARVWRYKPKPVMKSIRTVYLSCYVNLRKSPWTEDHSSNINLVLARNFEAYFEIEFCLGIV